MVDNVFVPAPVARAADPHAVLAKWSALVGMAHGVAATTVSLPSTTRKDRLKVNWDHVLPDILDELRASVTAFWADHGDEFTAYWEGLPAEGRRDLLLRVVPAMPDYMSARLQRLGRMMRWSYFIIPEVSVDRLVAGGHGGLLDLFSSRTATTDEDIFNATTRDLWLVRSYYDADAVLNTGPERAYNLVVRSLSPGSAVGVAPEREAETRALLDGAGLEDLTVDGVVWDSTLYRAVGFYMLLAEVADDWAMGAELSAAPV